MATPNLQLPEIAEAQANKHITHNTALGYLDSVLTAPTTLTLTSNAGNVTAAALRRARTLVLVAGSPAPTGAITITLPAIVRGDFYVLNTTAQPATLMVANQTGTLPVVAAGKIALMHLDGTRVRLAGGGEVEEAPQDGRIYGRSNKAWVEVPAGGGTGGNTGGTDTIYALSSLEWFSTGSGTPSYSTSAYAAKGEILTANLALHITAAVASIDVAVGESYAFQLLRLTGSSPNFTIAEIVAQATVSVADAARKFIEFGGLDARLVAGATYAAVTIRLGGTATAVNKIEFPASAPAILPFGMSHVGSVREAHLTYSAGEALPNYGAANSVKIAFRYGPPPVDIVEEAPINGTPYARQDGAWVPSVRAERKIIADAAAARTLALGDAGGYLRMNNAAANIVTIPANATVAFPLGTSIEIEQAGAGQTTIATAAGVTIRSPGSLALRRQYATARLLKVATDEWVLSGDLAP